ncbi:LysR family transcriptional regulator [Xenophilus azovorans]|uniref:LysR family transcriptional regulator n=1 Tax=Xenophilus azovorans TaxID=151755 RepID=UPI00068CFBD7|nr:LysR substrate-binding domain-containing protein [Xenophilus azovorans]
MELRHLRYFVAAAQAGNLHHAALKLHIVQPALSRQIQALEEQLATSLFERLPHGVQLTAAGQVFFEGAVRILDEVERLGTRTRRAARGQVGSLSIGFNDVGIRCPTIPESFRLFRLEYPEAELKLTLSKSQAQLAGLEDGSLHAGFVFDRPPHLPQFDAFPVFHDNRALVLPAGHPLASRDDLRLQDLRGEDFMLTRRDQLGAGWDRMMAACREGGLEPRVVQEMDNEQAIISLLIAGMGVGFLTESARPLLPPGLVMKRVLDFSVPMTLELVWLRTQRSPLLASFIEVVRRVHLRSGREVSSAAAAPAASSAA